MSIALLFPLFKRLDIIEKKAFIFTFLLLCILSSGFQYICLIRVEAWFVHPENTWLIPLRIAGSPVEEYLFWYSFALLMLEFYLYPRVYLRSKRITKPEQCKSLYLKAQ
ncbi:hypothetical protein QA601_14580 [Chitinispirillales bacterium ANBcel5]|uniref:hypothetical protein n=1 Tax=Cellulosispirillum alkaliphilum TaxID=3039283 RepID=UPI002A4FA3A5|nr:hypothetical protein [Chitinispirillales bacterium ANBcel5]